MEPVSLREINIESDRQFRKTEKARKNESHKETYIALGAG